MMDIDKLEAGHELDRLIAEKAMGWRKVFDEDQGSGMWILWVKQDGQEIYDQQLPKFSADIAAAWEVVEKLGLMVIPVDSYEGDEIAVDNIRWGWAASVESIEKDDVAPDSGFYLEVGTSGWAHAETAPLAICRAALKVAGASK